MPSARSGRTQGWRVHLVHNRLSTNDNAIGHRNTPMSMPPILFDRALLRKRRMRAAPRLSMHDFLHREAAAQLAESLSYINRAFPMVVEVGAYTDQLAQHLASRAGTTHYVRTDITPTSGTSIVTDEELLPFAENSVDAVVSILSLHWVNDLPGTLTQINRMLKPDGLFMAVIPGGETLRELRSIFTATEAARSGGITPRIAPFIDVRDAGALLQRTGFALPVADSDQLTITYPNLFALMDDLRGSAQSNILADRVQHFTPRSFFMNAAARYANDYTDSEGQITATAELITLTGWKKADTQQQPAKRGSGKVSLTQALN